MKRGAAAARPAVLLRDAEPAARAKNVHEFSIINGFAATLTAEEAAALRLQPGVSYVEPVAERHIFGGGLVPFTDQTRNFDGQTVPFGVDAVRAREVWSLTRGRNINVAIIDTGIDYRHPELSGVYAAGYNAITKTNDPRDDNGHGTHVAGTIAAADNSFGVVGVAPAVRVYSVKALRSDGTGTTEGVIAGLEWIINKKREVGGNWILNLSLGSAEQNAAEAAAIQRTVDEGILIVAASGNASAPGKPKPVSYPAAYPGVVAVGAVNAQNQLAAFSNQGPQIAVVGPGVDVLSTVPVGSAQISTIRSANIVYSGRPLDGSSKGTLSGPFVVCGLGRPEDFPAAVRGKIALIQRGEGISFANKTRAALAAGATGVVIYNNDTPGTTWTLIDEKTDPASVTFQWPLVMGISKQDGQSLIANMSGNITVTFADDDYSVFNGTSMASPHVVGVAALLWSLAPSATAANIALAINSTASDLGTRGHDDLFGSGVVDALNAAKYVAPTAFGLPALPAPGSVPSGRRSNKRGGN